MIEIEEYITLFIFLKFHWWLNYPGKNTVEVLLNNTNLTFFGSFVQNWHRGVSKSAKNKELTTPTIYGLEF